MCLGANYKQCYVSKNLYVEVNMYVTLWQRHSSPCYKTLFVKMILKLLYYTLHNIAW